jgi:Sec-independent protein secretion pathway component TatC
MKPPGKTEQLLNDILTDTASAESDQSMLRQMVQEARRRQHVRRLRQALLVLSAVGAVLIWLRPRERPATVQTAKEIQATLRAAPAVVYVETQPLPPSMVADTQTAPVAMVPTASPSITLVATRPANELFQQLDDDQLLALVASQPVALIRYGPHEAALVIPDEILQQGFLVE